MAPYGFIWPHMAPYGRVSLARVTYLVLDKADRMLGMGLQDDMEQASSAIWPERQMAFFSARAPRHATQSLPLYHKSIT